MTRTLLQRSTAALTAVSALALAGCSTSGAASADAPESSAAETVAVEHAQGTTDVPVAPENVITFDLGVLDSLEAIDEDVQGLPQANLPERFSQYATDEYVNAGSLKEPDLEAVAEADPDLIIITGRTADFYDELSEIAPTVDLSIDEADALTSFTEQSETLGKIFGKEAEVEEKLTAIDERIAETKEQAAGAGSAMFLLTNAGEVNAYGPNSRFGNIVFDVLGVEAAGDVRAEGTHGEAVSFEAIADAAPDRLYVLDRDTAVGQSGGEAAQQVLDNELVGGTPAAQQDRITYLDSSSWYLVGFGLNNFPSMITEIQDSLS
ncbi:siderophore ABC transporter substrate-binding protein [Kocuria sp.]|uniref:siderophore ABC transporter substrate-binding protein n=1 Tax=Kocuria sp. TaxID=1871328 RepID=UPI002810D79B|nr:siderophore ABC transporter substrate-binding protein [Kocuria sp.]